MKVRFTRRAAAEYDHILSIIRAASSSGATRVAARISCCLDVVATVPSIGRATSNPRLRRLAVAPFPYLIFYEVRGQEIVVIGIRHGARDPRTMPRGSDTA